ncbi:hypothetical protein [Halopseudomonas sp.]|uniref:hypothetical protein n=1 Tax=Halopseudomonas sp. TaxID=2901191 RepID=UPI00311F8528
MNREEQRKVALLHISKALDWVRYRCAADYDTGYAGGQINMVFFLGLIDREEADRLDALQHNAREHNKRRWSVATQEATHAA